MKEIQPIEYQNIRVLTSNQIAKFYEVDSKVISYNFKNNENKYVIEKDYFIITNENICYRDFQDNKKAHQPIYLWTEKGAFKHAKSLNTNKAWEAYEVLIDSYFKLKEIKERVEEIDPIDIAKRYIEAETERRKLLENNTKLEKENKELNTICNDFLSSKSSFTFAEVAKQLKECGRNKLFDFARKLGYIMDNGQPYQKYINNGMFVVRTVPKTINEEVINFIQPLLTSKGAKIIANEWNQMNFIDVFEEIDLL